MKSKPSRAAVNILSLMSDPKVFGSQFAGSTWNAWKVFLAVLFGLPLTTDEQRALYTKQTGRQAEPTAQASEAYLVVGRRAGKSLIAALIAVFLACLRDYRAILAPGERITIMVLAADRRQARAVFRYIQGLLEGVPMLAALIENATKELISLTNRVNIEVHTASFRAVRGYTIAAAICDEIAFWPNDESADPDTEILNALRPAMATVPNALLLCLSSPYARRGELWKAYKEHYGQDGDPALVWQADTKSMNPSVKSAIIEAAYQRDDTAARAEYGAEFRRDLEAFVSREAVEACIISGRLELPPVSSIEYVGFVDPSGGSQDSMTMAIAHRAGERLVLDVLLEARPPFSPEQIVADFATRLKAYRITSIVGDAYAGEWPREQFSKHGVSYQAAAKPKRELYVELLATINSQAVELLDQPRFQNQLLGLERRTARGGRDSIDHAPGRHDDLPNAVAGVLSLLAQPMGDGLGLLAYYREIYEEKQEKERKLEEAKRNGGVRLL